MKKIYIDVFKIIAFFIITQLKRGRRGSDRMVVGSTTTYAIADVVRSNLDQGEMHNIM